MEQEKAHFAAHQMATALNVRDRIHSKRVHIAAAHNNTTITTSMDATSSFLGTKSVTATPHSTYYNASPLWTMNSFQSLPGMGLDASQPVTPQIHGVHGVHIGGGSGSGGSGDRGRGALGQSKSIPIPSNMYHQEASLTMNDDHHHDDRGSDGSDDDDDDDTVRGPDDGVHGDHRERMKCDGLHMQLSGQHKHEEAMICNVLAKLLSLAIADTEVAVREQLLVSLLENQSFYPYLAQQQVF